MSKEAQVAALEKLRNDKTVELACRGFKSKGGDVDALMEYAACVWAWPVPDYWAMNKTERKKTLRKTEKVAEELNRLLFALPPDFGIDYFSSEFGIKPVHFAFLRQCLSSFSDVAIGLNKSHGLSRKNMLICNLSQYMAQMTGRPMREIVAATTSCLTDTYTTAKEVARVARAEING